LSRIYFDYNATSPLAPSVTRWLAEGDFFWGNPASQHSTGKYARARLDDVVESLQQTFQTNHRLFFHSGATEGINTFAQGFPGESVLFAYSPLDHSAVLTQAQRLREHGHMTLALPVDQQGQLRFDEAVEALRVAQKLHAPTHTLLNWTWVHNETGVVWPLTEAVRVKAATGCIVHVDAAQAPGKIANWRSLASELDMYSFSSHKFGALKGTGWSFIHPDLALKPLLLGGGQQHGLRSGTENVMAAWSVKLALEELVHSYHAGEAQDLMREVRRELDGWLRGRGERVCAHAPRLNSNTALFVLYAMPADLSLPLFDLAGLELSAGSACGSGTARPSHVLQALGLGKWARHGLRLSLPLLPRPQEWFAWQFRLAQVFEKIPKV
jgi:cysteine desulfurase